MAESVESLPQPKQSTNVTNGQDNTQITTITVVINSKIKKHIRQEYYRIRSNKRNDRSEAVQVSDLSCTFLLIQYLN